MDEMKSMWNSLTRWDEDLGFNVARAEDIGWAPIYKVLRQVVGRSWLHGDSFWDEQSIATTDKGHALECVRVLKEAGIQAWIDVDYVLVDPALYKACLDVADLEAFIESRKAQ